MGLQILKFTKNGAIDLVFNSLPAALRGLDPAVNVAMVQAVDDTLYTQLLGSPNAIISIVFDKNNPLTFNDFDGGFNWITGVQDADTQSLVNWFMNECVGSLQTFTVTRGDSSATVNMMNSPRLGFKPLQGKDDQYVGEILLRVQY